MHYFSSLSDYLAAGVYNRVFTFDEYFQSLLFPISDNGLLYLLGLAVFRKKKTW